MPKIYKKKMAKKTASSNGECARSDTPRKKKRTQPKTITIGSDQFPIENLDEVRGSTMEDVGELLGKIEYLVPGFVPKGMITGIIAEPGAGKSAYALAGLAKPVMTGGELFNGMTGTGSKRNVLWLPTENDMAITYQRILDWDIPKDKFILPFADDPLRAVDLTNQAHLDQIELLIHKYEIELSMLDSLRGGHGSDENNSKVGQVLQSVAGIAERTGIAFLIVHHTKKLTVDEEITANSSRGSNAILAMMRAQIAIDKPDPHSKWCRLQVLKENLGIAPAPVGFQVTPTGLQFGAVPQKPSKNAQKDEAAIWLRGRMKPGTTYKASEILAEAVQYGHSERTIRKAATEKLHIKPKAIRENGKISEWKWRMPTA
jgi:hypothetical protein